MRRNTFANFHLNRRDLLKVGTTGFCALCLTTVAGCAFFGEDRAPEDRAPGDSASDMGRKGLIGETPAQWSSPLDDQALRCELCPRLCILEAGERAPCRVRENREGVLYSLAFGNPALVQKDPVERKPFFHVLPGSRALSVSTAGCNLACAFCEVWDMALVNPEEVYAYDLPPKKVVDHARDTGVRSLSFAFGEPVVFYEYMMETIERSREEGLLNLVHTAGYIQPEPLRALAAKIDAVNVDLKSFNPDFYREHVGGELEPVLSSLQILREAGVHLEITNIIIPTLNDHPEEIERMCRWIVAELGADVPLHFARFYPLYKLSGLPRTPVSSLEKARDTAMAAGLEYVYIAKVTGHDGENTYCPHCGGKIISRLGFVIDELNLTGGACGFCQKAIPGIWN